MNIHNVKLKDEIYFRNYNDANIYGMALAIDIDSGDVLVEDMEADASCTFENQYWKNESEETIDWLLGVESKLLCSWIGQSRILAVNDRTPDTERSPAPTPKSNKKKTEGEKQMDFFSSDVKGYKGLLL